MKKFSKPFAAVIVAAQLSGCGVLTFLQGGSSTSPGPVTMSLEPIPSTMNIESSVESSMSADVGLYGPRKKFASLPPRTRDAHYQTGAGYLRAGQLGLAVRSLKRSIAVEGEHAKTYNALGAAYANLRRPDIAERYFVRSVELDPGSNAGRFNLGLFLMRQGRRDAAEFHLARIDGAECNEVAVVDMRSTSAPGSVTSDVVSSCGL